MSKKFSSGKNSRAISDRSGMEFPYSEMVVEPGTKYFVHYTESDGKYNLVTHPQNFTPKNLADGRPVAHPRPPENKVNEGVLTDENDNPILAVGQFGSTQAIHIITSS